MQTQYTTILGIFASVILAFVGSFTFSNSVPDHIADANIYRVIIVSLIVGMVFYNMVCVLIHFLREINGMKKKEVHKASFLVKDNWAFNIVIGILIIATLLIWLKPFHTNEQIGAVGQNTEITEQVEAEMMSEETP